MKTVGQRNLKLLGGQEKPTDGRTPDGQADSTNTTFFVRGIIIVVKAFNMRR
jgi:hypothetical protein